MDQYELAELRQSVGRRLGGFYNSFRYQANRALWILPHLSVGKLFSDTLGKFYPFVVNTLGQLTINTSAAFPNALIFHNTATAGTDIMIVSAGAKILGIAPNISSDGGVTFTVYRDSNLNTAVWSVFRVGGNYSAVQIEGQTTWIGNATRGTTVVSVKSGVPVDGDFPQLAAGMVVWDDTDSKLYVRNNAGTWKSVTLT